MVNNITAGVIGCEMREEFFEASARNVNEKIYWKKILSKNGTINANRFPNAEVVNSEETILQDADISLVFVAADNLDAVSKVIQSGKAVRVVH